MVDHPVKREGRVASYVRREVEAERPHGLQTAEYALVLALVALIVVVIMLLTGDQMRSQMEQIVVAFSAASGQTP